MGPRGGATTLGGRGYPEGAGDQAIERHWNGCGGAESRRAGEEHAWRQGVVHNRCVPPARHSEMEGSDRRRGGGCARHRGCMYVALALLNFTWICRWAFSWSLLDIELVPCWLTAELDYVRCIRRDGLPATPGCRGSAIENSCCPLPPVPPPYPSP